jgi:hypothetical protein
MEKVRWLLAAQHTGKETHFAPKSDNEVVARRTRKTNKTYRWKPGSHGELAGDGTELAEQGYSGTALNSW